MRCYLTNGNPLWNFWDLKKTKITLSKNLSRDMDKIKKLVFANFFAKNKKM